MKVGLILSGGGVRGVAHIGAIKALEESRISVTHVAGSSAGAVVGVLYAYGYDWQEIFNFFKGIQLLDVKKYARNKPGFIDTEKFYNQFKNYLDEDNFMALQKKLKITATDILHGSLKVFTSGELIRPVLASAAFPGIFAPVKIGSSYYIDGGALNSFPVELLKQDCDFLIGSYANWLKKLKINELKHSYNVVERAFKIKAVRDDLLKFTDCDVIIAPKELGNYGTFDMKRLDEIFQLGYLTTKQALSNSKLFNVEYPLSSTIN